MSEQVPVNAHFDVASCLQDIDTFEWVLRMHIDRGFFFKPLVNRGEINLHQPLKLLRFATEVITESEDIVRGLAAYFDGALGCNVSSAFSLEGFALCKGEAVLLAGRLEFTLWDVVLGVVRVFPDKDCIGCFEDVGAAEEDLNFPRCWQCFDGTVSS